MLTEAFIADLKTSIKAVVEREFERLTEAGNIWWKLVAVQRQTTSAKERLAWLLDSARIRQLDPQSMAFEEALALSLEIENQPSGAGLKITRDDLEDVVGGVPGGAALDAAAHWARGVAARAAYWPQELVQKAIRDNIPTYDGLAFFHTAHPLNPYKSTLGTFANTFTGAASGPYPGALPIHLTGAGSVNIDTARENVAKAIAYAASVKMPSGDVARKLRPVALIVPPALAHVAELITGAEVLPFAVGANAAGGADVRPIKRKWGLADPVQADELGAGYTGGSDTTWYLAMRGAGEGETGAFIYSEREPFSVRYHGPDTDAQLQAVDSVEWSMRGRNACAGGHPYYLFRAQAA
jgi:phage major head subunit gpT-like protein